MHTDDLVLTQSIGHSLLWFQKHADKKSVINVTRCAIVNEAYHCYFAVSAQQTYFEQTRLCVKNHKFLPSRYGKYNVEYSRCTISE